MNAIRIRQRLEAPVIDSPELAPLVGKTVEIIVLVEPETSNPRPAPKAGSARGKVRMSPDFDAPLDDFAEYMK